jgi:WXG100 family type VII secretion target
VATDGQITYNQGTIQNAVQSIDTFVKNMGGTLDSVESDFNRLRANWDSESAKDFDSCKARWQEGARDITATLTKLKVALAGAGDRMAQTDQRAKGLFTG